MTRSGNHRQNDLADRALWRRGRNADAPEDEVGYFLDLAAFAEDRLDADEHERVAALLARDPTAAEDVAAARAHAGGLDAGSQAQLEQIVARAAALGPRPNAPSARILAFRRAPLARPVLTGFAGWASLAAAIALIGWLGFAIGTNTALTALARPSLSNTDVPLSELFDPTNGFFGDLGEGQQT